MADDIFCQIVAGTIPATILYLDDEVMAFRDINPKAPVHVVIIPRRHITSVAELTEDDAAIVGRMVMVAKIVAKKEGISERGYRLLINNGADSGMAVPHLHMHLLGGRRLSDNLC
ncbi:MAG: histidine triad nucleotide-binding protein [Chloroflexota bacterium]